MGVSKVEAKGVITSKTYLVWEWMARGWTMKSPVPQLKERRFFVSWWKAVRLEPAPTGANSVQVAVPVLSILLKLNTELARAVDMDGGKIVLHCASMAQQRPASTFVIVTLALGIPYDELALKVTCLAYCTSTGG